MIKINNSASLSHDAMRYGTYMGLLWVVKFVVILVAFFAHNEGVMILGGGFFLLATVAVPVIAGVMACQHRNTLEDRAISYGRAWHFIVLIYLYAALLSAAGHYIYFAFVDQGRFFPLYLEYAHQAGLDNDPMLRDLLKTLEESIPSLTPIRIVMQMFLNNVSYGVLQALVIALFVMKRKSI